MTSISEAFEKFRGRLEISETERNDAIRRHKEIRKLIRAEFDVENDFLTGSYARHTKTKPLKDIDIFFCLGEKDGHWRKKPPHGILDAFKECLVAEYGVNNVDSARRCVTVGFDKRNPAADDEGKILSIDAVPAYKLDECFEIPDSNLGKWIKTNPSIHKDEATAKNLKLGGKWIPLVKMLKSWNRSTGKPIKPSFLVEIMALDLVDSPFTSYPDEVRRFFAAALEGIKQDWADPAGFGPSVSDQMTEEKRRQAISVLRQAEIKVTRAAHLERQGKNSEALAIWREVMGKYFPTR